MTTLTTWTLADLESKRDSLVQQIRELVDSETSLTTEELEKERARLEFETANVLREIDARKDRGERTKTREKKPAKPMSPKIAFTLGVFVTLVLGGLVFVVMKYATERDPMQQAAAPAAATQTSPAIQSLESSVKADPDNLDNRIELARAYLDNNNMMGVFEQTEYVLSKSPDDSRALTYQALVRIGMGEGAEAKELLNRARKSDPNFIDASLATAWLQMQEGQPAEAEKTLDETMKRHPEEKERLQQVRDHMMSHQNVAQVAAKKLPEGHPPIPAASSGSGPKDQIIRVTLDLDATSKSRLGETGIIFVLARAEKGGPAILVKKLETNTLPITCELTSADSMMGQSLPAKMRVEARLDSDGDAATKNPTDPFGAQDGVSAGSTITLAMK